jgi:hypothetical protein
MLRTRRDDGFRRRGRRGNASNARTGARYESTGAEAPRPARDRIDGRSPGSRVAARHRLPGWSQWLCGTGSPLTVAGAAVELEPEVPHHIPCSLSRERPSMGHLTVAVRPLSIQGGSQLGRRARRLTRPRIVRPGRKQDVRRLHLRATPPREARSPPRGKTLILRTSWRKYCFMVLWLPEGRDEDHRRTTR